jgi:uncharacterized protein YjaZ
MTDIIVHDTIALFQPFFTSQERPKVLFERVNQSLLSPNGLMSQLQRALSDRRRNGFAVMEAAQHDGYEALMGQQGWGLFNPTRSREASAWAFAQYEESKILAQIERLVMQYVAHPTIAPHAARLLPQIECFLLPGDPANRTFMAFNQGLSCMGGRPGYLLIRVWPSPGNLARIGPVLARLVAQNVRQAALAMSGLLTLGDWLILEGLAASFVERVAPSDIPPWLVAFAKPADWEQALAHVAGFYQLPSYDQLEVNVYGSRFAVGAERLPQACALDRDELGYATEVLGAALSVADATTIAAYMYGDAIVAAQGHPTVGLPPYAGFEVGYHLIQDYLKQTGQSLTEAIVTSSQTVLAASAGLAARPTSGRSLPPAARTPT